MHDKQLRRRLASAILWAIRHKILRGKLRKIARRLLPETDCEVMVDRVRLLCSYHGNSTENALLLYGRRHSKLRSLDEALDGLEAGDVFVDVGANCGVFSTLAARRVGPTGRVVAIEPIPVMVDRLRTNIALNGFDNVSVFKLAAGEASSEATLSVHPRNYGQSSMAADQKGGRPITVSVAPLIDILAQAKIAKVDALKIDVEGYEDRVLLPFIQHAPRELWPKRIFMEVRHARLWRVDCLQALVRAGYRQTWNDGHDAALVREQRRSIPFDEFCPLAS